MGKGNIAKMYLMPGGKRQMAIGERMESEGMFLRGRKSEMELNPGKPKTHNLGKRKET